MGSLDRPVRSLLVFRMLLAFGRLSFIEGANSVSMAEFRARFFPDESFDNVYRNMDSLQQLGIISKYTEDLNTRSIGFVISDPAKLAVLILDLSANFDLEQAAEVLGAIEAKGDAVGSAS